jgi:hypothetical protein
MVLMGLILNSCGSSDNNTNNKNNDSTNNEERAKIVGTWISSTIDGIHDTRKIITFNSDGTAQSNCSDMTMYTWTVSNTEITLELTSSNDVSSCSVDLCSSISIDSTGNVLTAVCDDTTVFKKTNDGIVIESGYIQYRNYENSSKNEIRGWLNLKKYGNPIAESDISQILLKNNSGATVQIHGMNFVTGPYFIGTWNNSSSAVDFSGPLQNSGFSINFESKTLNPGYYTYEVTKHNGEIITFEMNYPAQIALPFVSTSSINYEWLEGGGLKLTWENPSGSFDRLVVYLCDQAWNDILYVSLPNTSDQLIIPSAMISQINSLMGPDSVKVRIQTRNFAGTIDHNNFARGYSNEVDIPW